MTVFDPAEELLEKDVDVAETPARDLEHTMGASAYTGDYGHAMDIVEETEYEVVELQDLCERVFRKSRFTRVYVDNPEYGHPYIAPTEVGSLKPWYRQINNTSKAYVSKKQHDINEYNVEEDWILITCSGSVNVGSVFMATDFLSDYFLTHDMIRVVPEEDTLEGYLYAYLDSWVGRVIMLHNEFGIGIDHIEPEQIEDMPVVLPPEDVRREIHENVKEAYAAREEFLQKNKRTVEETGDVLEALGNNEDVKPDDFEL
ncbi:restriction endonuclease subunit S [Halobacterium zhouii]|uniref:restriction endonuclease subunit S n=1 Tax=Halobacterium zhouii TaxID=2902624 RepID=UPI001E463703|nr:restriction endonuclease subunit S [Halobacterium zhouii]